MPRRSWSSADTDELVTLLSSELRVRGSTATLRPIQAIAIAEAVDAGGLLGVLGVGSGKTLVSLIAPLMMGCARPVLIVPAALRAKTEQDRRLWERELRLHPAIRVISYESLQHPDHADDLSMLAPDCLICDEAHRLKHTTSARTKRVLRYLYAHPTCRLIVLSGSSTSSSLLDYEHLVRFALPGACPVPRHRAETERWAAALDADTPEWDRPSPRALLALSPPTDDEAGADELTTARRRYSRRLRDTRGVVISHDVRVRASLEIRGLDVVCPPAIRGALTELERTWRTPTGDELRYALEVWRYGRELSMGFFGRWEPAPPAEWLAARAAWALFMRGKLACDSPAYDSPARVALAFPDSCELARWREVRDSYDPKAHTVIEWIDDTIARRAADWLADPDPGIVWTEHVALGRRVAELAGVPYLGGGDESAEAILNIHGPFVTSIQARSEGVNLQDRYARNLICSAPASAVSWEQLLGRTYREGQDRARVLVDLCLHSAPLCGSLATALRRAQYIQDTKEIPQRLLLAHYGFDITQISSTGVVPIEEDTDQEEQGSWAY